MEELRLTWHARDGYQSPDDPRISGLKERLDAMLRESSDGRESANVSYWFYGDGEVAIGCTVERPEEAWSRIRSVLDEEGLLEDVSAEAVEFEEMTRRNLPER